MKRRYLALALFLAVAAAVAALVQPGGLTARNVQGAPRAPEQPMVKFSHKFHITDAGLECASCHSAAQKSRSVADNLHPAHEQCQSCHEEQITSACGFCHTSPDSIEPREVPHRDMLFAHEKHLLMSGVQCSTCHAGIEQDSTAAQEHLPAMTACATCHDNVRATSRCETCHTNLAQLLPNNHLRSDFRRYHGEEIRVGAMSVECATCHTESFCQECHGPVQLKAFGLKDLSADPRPRTSPKDQPAQTTLQRVHDLNYRLTHGVDAKARQAECATCHDTREFCVECHQAGGNINQSKFKPASHFLPGFTTFGKGSGGGLHAKEAERDMESCVGCHDVPGQDPICLTCHNANGQVR
jgi:hypothetical protein